MSQIHCGENHYLCTVNRKDESQMRPLGELTVFFFCVPIMQQRIRQCIWLISTIHSAGRITFDQLCQKWKEKEMSAGMELNRTTFNRMRDAVQTMFGVIIDCERKGGYYYYIYNLEELDCPVRSPEACALCACKKMTGSLLFCHPQHCFFSKIKK